MHVFGEEDSLGVDVCVCLCPYPVAAGERHESVSSVSSIPPE